jgi:hypothetical protein
MINSINTLAWEVVRLADTSPAFHFFGLLARGGRDRSDSANGPSGPPSYGVSWALMLFCAILGLIVTLTPARRSSEVKRPKEE